MNQKLPQRQEPSAKDQTPLGSPNGPNVAPRTAPPSRRRSETESDFSETPRRRSGTESLAEEERRAGLTTILFALTVAAVALFSCLLVVVMTVRSALPSVPSQTPSGEETNAPTGDSGSVLFSPGAAVLPKTDGNTQSIADIDSAYAVLVDAASGQILAGKDANVRFSPASMTKVMTLLVACENLKTGDLTQDLTNTEDLHNYVRSGNYRGLTVHWADVGDGADLLEQLYGIGVESAADCVMMVVSYICPRETLAESETAFVELMNAEVAKMGLQNTHFDNPSGYESENNYTTASDMAAIMMRALECDLIREILSTPSRVFSAFGYNSSGVFVPSYNSYFYSTLFNVNGTGRIAAYEKQYGTFKLSALTLMGGKTGSLTYGTGYVYSLVSFATNADKSKTYICVTGQTTKGSDVMKDAKTIYDNYAK